MMTSDRNPTFDEELLSAYLDDELDEDGRQHVERLLIENPACRRLLEEFKAIRSHLQELPPQASPASLSARITQGLDPTAQRRAEPSGGPAAMATDGVRTHRRVWRQVAITALSLAAGLVVMFLVFSDPAVVVGHKAQKAPRSEVADEAAPADQAEDFTRQAGDAPVVTETGPAQDVVEGAGLREGNLFRSPPSQDDTPGLPAPTPRGLGAAVTLPQPTGELEKAQSNSERRSAGVSDARAGVPSGEGQRDRWFENARSDTDALTGQVVRSTTPDAQSAGDLSQQVTRAAHRHDADVVVIFRRPTDLTRIAQSSQSPEEVLAAAAKERAEETLEFSDSAQGTDLRTTEDASVRRKSDVSRQGRVRLEASSQDEQHRYFVVQTEKSYDSFQRLLDAFDEAEGTAEEDVEVFLSSSSAAISNESMTEADQPSSADAFQSAARGSAVQAETRMLQDTVDERESIQAQPLNQTPAVPSLSKGGANAPERSQIPVPAATQLDRNRPVPAEPQSRASAATREHAWYRMPEVARRTNRRRRAALAEKAQTNTERLSPSTPLASAVDQNQRLPAFFGQDAGASSRNARRGLRVLLVLPPESERPRSGD